MKTPGFKNIAIIRLSSLGDIVHTLPAFNLLRKEFPRAKISWFAEPNGAKLLKNVPGIDEIIAIDLKAKGFFNKLKEIRRIRSLYRIKFDLIFDFQGLLKSAILAWMLKGYTIGFGKENLREPQARFFYNHHVRPFPEDSHVIFKNIYLLNDAVVVSDPPVVEFPLAAIPASEKVENFLSGNNLQKHRYLILNVGGGWESKLLAPPQYIDVAQKLKNKFKHEVVLLWGNGKEEQIAREIARETGALVSVFFDFSELILFIRYARLIVTADTLALHVADMVKTPSVGFFGPTSPLRNGSLLEESVAVYEKLDCGFCYKKKCAKIDCIKKISPDKIVEAIEQINEKYRRNHH